MTTKTRKPAEPLTLDTFRAKYQPIVDNLSWTGTQAGKCIVLSSIYSALQTRETGTASDSLFTDDQARAVMDSVDDHSYAMYMRYLQMSAWTTQKGEAMAAKAEAADSRLAVALLTVDKIQTADIEESRIEMNYKATLHNVRRVAALYQECLAYNKIVEIIAEEIQIPEFGDVATVATTDFRAIEEAAKELSHRLGNESSATLDSIKAACTQIIKPAPFGRDLLAAARRELRELAPFDHPCPDLLLIQATTTN